MRLGTLISEEMDSLRAAIRVSCTPLGLRPNSRWPWRQVKALLRLSSLLETVLLKNAALSKTVRSSAPSPCGLSVSPRGTDGRGEIRGSECGTGKKRSCERKRLCKQTRYLTPLQAEQSRRNAIMFNEHETAGKNAQEPNFGIAHNHRGHAIK